jgi:universal stress protein A
MFAPKNILVPTDFSDFSDKALQKAVDIATQHKSKIYLLHVVDRVVQCAVDYCIDFALAEQIEQQSMKFAEERLKKEAAAISANGVQIVFDVQKGATYDTIIKEQEDKDIDLIVIGSHGKTGLIHHLGSVAEKVVRGAKCPVLLIKE